MLNDNLTNKVDKNSAARLASIELGPDSNTAGHGGFIDFHYNGSAADYTSRIIESSSGDIVINGISIATLNSKVTQIVSECKSFHQIISPGKNAFAVPSSNKPSGWNILSATLNVNNTNISSPNYHYTIALFGGSQAWIYVESAETFALDGTVLFIYVKTFNYY